MGIDGSDDEAEVWPTSFEMAQPSPWTMRGQHVTARLTVTDDVIARYLHSDLWPPRAESYASRVRFYALEVDGERFHETAISLPIRAGGLDGEASILLWSDYERYQAWARDGYGWTVAAGQFECSGSLWAEDAAIDDVGSAVLRAIGAEISLVVDEMGGGEAPSEGWMTQLPWLAPRRVLHRGGLEGETREILKVTPTMNRPGTRARGRGRLSIELGPDDPLSSRGALECDLEVVRGFELTVGDQVDLLDAKHIPPRSEPE